MKSQSPFNMRGVTLIELLVALVICGVVIGAIYRLFIVQTRAYTVQDQVVEVQQNVRSAMEIMLRDLRMTGYDDDSTAVTLSTPIIVPGDQSITVRYEYNGAQYQVQYWRNAGSSILFRNDGAGDQRLLENVYALNFKYGIDTDEDGSMDLNGDGIIDDNDWVAAAGVGTSKIIAVRVTLTGRPDQTNPDVKTRVSPRTLTSAITFRNLIMK
jgi:prepilin-type N-terminal cleavage/methylation domain-containing protein